MKKILFIFYFSSVSLCFAQNVVIDKRAIGQVGTNSAAAVASESLIAKNYEKIRKAQESISKYVTIVQVNMEKIRKTKQDVSAFKEGTENFIVMNRSMISAFQELQLLVVDMGKYPIGSVAYSKQIHSISERIVSIGATFVYSVTDGKVTLKGVPVEKQKVNLIDPVQRLELINRCIDDLTVIRHLIWQIRLNICSRNRLHDAALAITPRAVYNYHIANQIAKDIVSVWK